jgi:hypothetical protein
MLPGRMGGLVRWGEGPCDGFVVRSHAAAQSWTAMV